MKVLLIGYGNSIFIMDYIEHVLAPHGDEVTLLSINEDYSQYREYYKKKHVRVVMVKPYRMIHNKIPVIGKKLSRALLRPFLRKLGAHDAVHIHFVTPWAMCIGELFKEQFPTCKYVISFHGSDIFRTEKVNQIEIKPHLKYADIITVLTEAMKEELQKQYRELVTSAKILRFGNPNIEHIIELQKSYTRSLAKSALDVPTDSCLIVCGYKSGEPIRHEEMLKQLNRLEPHLKENIYVILPLTYGGSSEYNEKVSLALRKSELNGRVIIDRMSDDELSLLRIAGDIYLNIQTTDAISASMIEHLFCRAIVINGEWLDYRELKNNGVHYYEIKETGDLLHTVSSALSDIDSFYEKTKDNPQIIYKMCSWESQSRLWRTLYLMEEKHEQG